MLQSAGYKSLSGRTFGSSKVDDVSVSLEHVDLLNSLDRLDIKLLERRLQLFIIHSRALVYLLDLSSRCALSTICRLSVSRSCTFPSLSVRASG
jgi:hypothetical protein